MVDTCHPPDGADSLRKLRVLHVDDDELFLELYRHRFAAWFDILSVSNPLECPDLLRENPFDAVILDYEMPGMNGLELLKKIRLEHSIIPVIFYTGQGDESIAREAFISGASDYFAKDLGSFAHDERLLNSIIKAIEKKRIEETLKEAQQRYQQVFENSFTGILHTTIEGELIDYNQSALRMFGFTSHEDLINHTDGRLTYFYREAGEREHIIQMLIQNGGVLRNYIQKLRRKDGSFLTCKISLILTSGWKGEKIIEVFIEDVSESLVIKEKEQQYVQELQERERLTSNILRHCPHAVAVYDQNLNFLMTSDRYLEDYGLTGRDIIGKNHMEIFPETSGEWLKSLREALSGKEVFNENDSFFRHDGTVEYTKWKISPWYDIHGTIGGVFTITELTTARMKSEETQSQERQRFQLLANHAPIGVCLADPEGNCIYANETMCRMTGTTPDEVVGLSWVSLIHPDERDQIYQQWISSVKEKKNSEIEGRFLHKNGSTIWVHFLSVPIPNEQGDITGFLGIGKDVTSLRQLKEDFQSEQNMLTHSPNVVFKWRNQEGWPPDHVSPNVTRHFGYAPEDFTSGRIVYDSIIHPEDVDRVREETAFYGNTGALSYELEYRIRHVDGRYLWVREFAILIRDSNNNLTHFLGYVQDITERRLASEALQRTNKALKDFTYMVSHDLKNPLNIAMDYLRIIKEDPSTFDKFFDRVQGLLSRMAEFVTNLLQLSRAGRVIGELSEIDPEEMIGSIFIEQKLDAPAMDLVIRNPLRKIYGDRSGLNQVFTNLVENAIKYRNTSRDRLEIEIETLPEKDYTTLVFRDNGSGIELEHLDKVFDPGFSLRKDRYSGFGLAISSKIIEAHGGTIRAVSEGKNKGTSFYIKLPCIPPLHSAPSRT